jgi:hypothetical protein
MRYTDAFTRSSILLLVILISCGDGTAPPGDGVPGNVVITPGQARLAAVGDTSRLRAAFYDEFGLSLPGVAVTWTALDPQVFSVDQAGLVTGLQPMSVGRVVAAAVGRADTAYVVVANPDASPCLGYSAPVTLAVGQATDVSLTDAACIASAGSDDEYLVVPSQASAIGWSTVSLDVTGTGLSTVAPSPVVSPSAGNPLLTREPARGFAFERQIRNIGEREVMPMTRRAREVFGRDARSEGRANAVPAYLNVGDLVALNVSVTSTCTTPVLRTGRVAAVGARAIVVHDTANPAGGFTDADYQRFAVAFDTLIVPVADAAFGAPTDIDVNGKVVIFFTRAVNELTPANAGYYIGGFFHPRDVLPQYLNGYPYCPASNEREMFYMLVPDPSGTINGNARTVGFVDSTTVGVLAHEHQHLVNFTRRAYVNYAFTDEEVWLNEGLSHIAEELVFYRAAGAAPRQNIGASRFGTQPFDGMFSLYMAANFARLRTFLENPQIFSPYSSDDDIGTRGAVWAFLRYAADRRGTGDGDLWMQLVNSPTRGFTNLANVFGAGVVEMVHEWNLSVYADDHVPGVAAAYAQPSWNFRTAYPALPSSPTPYPLGGAVGTLSNEVTRSVSLRGGSAAFLRFAVTPGREAAIRVASRGSVAPRTVRATIIRTR